MKKTLNFTPYFFVSLFRKTVNCVAMRAIGLHLESNVLLHLAASTGNMHYQGITCVCVRSG